VGSRVSLRRRHRCLPSVGSTHRLSPLSYQTLCLRDDQVGQITCGPQRDRARRQREDKLYPKRKLHQNYWASITLTQNELDIDRRDTGWERREMACSDMLRRIKRQGSSPIARLKSYNTPKFLKAARLGKHTCGVVAQHENVLTRRLFPASSAALIEVI
jgi:hypothetical protein